MVRPASRGDVPALEKLIGDKKYIHIDFAVEQLPNLVNKEVFMVATAAERVVGFLYVHPYRRVSAVWDGIGVRRDFAPQPLLNLLLPAALARLRTRGITELFYVGDDDWLVPLLLKDGFELSQRITLYEKVDFAVPAAGNPTVHLRAARTADIPAIATLDQESFGELWRLDEPTFAHMLPETLHFSVALLDGRIVGYQCCLLIGQSAHLSRLAVHPAHQGQQIGTRLLGDVIRQLAQERVDRITVNTQQDNVKSRRLYRWFNFYEIGEVPVLRLRF